ncbi:GNAT family N-acetyltransferase [Marinomonas sp. IMCC 4694]|uniref:GNAT family N-acetyltransferase n=1 Tax=Marinomonas sp. IMCC 4694 TaxID=2605432 RepID=UPI0011E663DE|nr:GNAT family N-acetyltransferase [Marinomonas sp. IMCC 4694]TYL48762.1 GNAT family N-acetyltransferase [Marinomonas sp. IMCC 4694]
MTDRVNLRPATMADAKRLFEWRNDPETRKASHNNEEIRFDVHLKWLEVSLNSPDTRRLWVAEWQGRAVGSCRADRAGRAWTLSWVVAPQARGKGVAQQMLSTLIAHFQDPLLAEIKVGNMASIKASENVGFVFEKEDRGVLHYVYPRSSGPST